MIRSVRSARMGLTVALLGAALGAGAPLAAQEPTGEVARKAVTPTGQGEAGRNQIDIVQHIANSHEVETPFGVWHLPQGWTIPLGTRADGRPRVLDLSPTKHMVYMVLAAVIVALTFLLSARSIPRSRRHASTQSLPQPHTPVRSAPRHSVHRVGDACWRLPRTGAKTSRLSRSFVESESFSLRSCFTRRCRRASSIREGGGRRRASGPGSRRAPSLRRVRQPPGRRRRFWRARAGL